MRVSRLLACFAPSLLACAGTGDGCLDDNVVLTDSGEEADPPDVDFLLVVDSSGSMKEESSAVLLGADEIVEALGDADWRIGVAMGAASAALRPGGWSVTKTPPPAPWARTGSSPALPTKTVPRLTWARSLPRAWPATWSSAAG